jgi:hypothetical protein
MQYECGFQFSGPGEFRNCGAFVTPDGRSGVICPDCQQAWVDGQKVKLQPTPPAAARDNES